MFLPSSVGLFVVCLLDHLCAYECACLSAELICTPKFTNHVKGIFKWSER